MSGNESVLIYCEMENGKLSMTTRELLSAGNRLACNLGGELSAVIIGYNIRDQAQEAVAYGARKVYIVNESSLEDFSAESYLIALEKVVRQVNPDIVLMGQTAAGRDLAPWLAFRLNTVATMDCTALEIDSHSKRLLMTRPVYGGNAQAVQVSANDPQIATVRMKAMLPAVKDNNSQGQIINIPPVIDSASLKTRVIDRRKETEAGVRLEEARVVVAGGRGMGSIDGFRQLEEVAGLLNGAVGATRPPCDKKWISESRQIGLTGKVVSPDLYIAVGLSGASQHLSGFSGAKVIVAINKDPEANIFRVAHYGIIGDWKSVLPPFIASLKEIGRQ